MTRFPCLYLPLAALLVVSGCVSLPDLGPATSRAPVGAYPRLLPMSELLAENQGAAKNKDTAGEATAEELAARAAALRARAATIRPAD